VTLADEADAYAWFAARDDFDSAILPRLTKLATMLREENARQNLVSAESLSAVWVRHFADSAQLVDHVPREDRGLWLDLGSGAGFPGLVIAACRPDWLVELVESRGKRVSWLERATAALGLDNVRIAGCRVQKLPTAPACIISARAFAPLPQLIGLSARFSTPQTLWLLPKGRSGRQELAAMPTSIRTMFHVEQSITEPDSVVLVGRGRPTLPTARHK
jgi:16S rRNA (guanine527-N7)-methyltransferase